MKYYANTSQNAQLDRQTQYKAILKPACRIFFFLLATPIYMMFLYYLTNIYNLISNYHEFFFSLLQGNEKINKKNSLPQKINLENVF